jgi:hypothetical protein
MATAAEYRQYAQECIICARDSTSDPVRKQFLELAKLWMMAAQRVDGDSPPLQPAKMNGDHPPDWAS